MQLIRKIIILPFFLLTLYCHKNSPTDMPSASYLPSSDSKPRIISQKADSNHEVVKEVIVGTHEAFEKVPQLEIEMISEADYIAVRPVSYFEPGKRISKSTLKKYSDYSAYKNQYTYKCLGFYKKLNCYAFTKNYTEDGFGFAQLYLVDISKRVRFRITSFGDDSVSLPVLSKCGKFLLYYDESTYEPDCTIRVLKINYNAKPEHFFTEFGSYMGTDFVIDTIIAHSDSDFYIKGIKKSDTIINQSVYFKLNLKQ